MQERYLIKQMSEPLTFFLPVDVESPQRIVQRFGPHVHLSGESLLGKMLQRAAQLEFF